MSRYSLSIASTQKSVQGDKKENVKAAPTSILASSESCSLLIGPQAGPDAHMAAPLRPSGSHLIRVTEEHLELLVGGPVRYEDRAASA